MYTQEKLKETRTFFKEEKIIKGDVDPMQFSNP